MEVDKSESSRSEQSISECFNEAVKTFEEISNCDLATNSSEVQVKNASEIDFRILEYCRWISSDVNIDFKGLSLSIFCTVELKESVFGSVWAGNHCSE